jgi:hypothetical protein
LIFQAWSAIYHIVPAIASQIRETPLRGINSTTVAPIMPPSQGRLPTWVLVMAAAFPHHALQENTAQGTCPTGGPDVRQLKSGERCGGK